MAFDTKKWLMEAGFSEAEIAELAPKFESRAEYLEKSQLRLSDYSRNQDALRKEQTELQAANDRITAEMAQRKLF